MTPDDYTIQEFYLPVGDGHELYVQDWGYTSAKKPILFLHGGPGSGVSNRYKTNFDPRRQRVVFFDQRGSGQSRPFGSLEHNTTDDLIEDIAKILDHLALKSVVITGGSWGACLALAFALKHPRMVDALVLRGIYTGSKRENDWINYGGYRHYFPDVWDAYVAATPAEHKLDPSAYHIPRVLSDDPVAAKQSAYAVSNAEGAVLNLDDRFNAMDFEEFDPTMAKIETYYIHNNCFMPDRHILKNAHKLTMPVWLIQGRYDSVCPPITAYELSKEIPNCELIWTIAGHGNDRANYDVNRTILLQIAAG